MLYLVKCKVYVSYYMGDRKVVDQIHIVEAESEKQASDKVEDYYSKKDSEFSVSHWVDFEYANEIIL